MPPQQAREEVKKVEAAANNKPELRDVQEQPIPSVRVVGRISPEAESSDGQAGTKFLIHTGWSRKTYQLSVRGMKVLRTLDINVIDEPAEYTI